MTVISPAIGTQGGSHSAQVFRQLISALAGQDVETFVNSISAQGEAHGLIRKGHLAVSEKGTPDMSVDVAAGICLITGDQSLAQGPYAFTNDATVNLAVTTADGSNPRWDLVCAQVRDDTEDGGGTDDARLMIVDGTAAASPADPTIPDGCLVLARVVVPASAASVTDTDITMLATARSQAPWGRAAVVMSLNAPWAGLATGWTNGAMVFLRIKATRTATTIGANNNFLDLPEALRPTHGTIWVNAAVTQDSSVESEVVSIDGAGVCLIVAATTLTSECTFSMSYPRV